MKYTDNFRRLEEDILGYLQSDWLMGARPGLLLEPGDVESIVAQKVTKALGAGADGKVGLGWYVVPIEDMLDDTPEVEFAPLLLPITVDIVENKTLNNGPRGPQMPIRYLAAYAQKILKCYSPQNLTTDFVPEKTALSLFTKQDDENLRFCRVMLHTYESDPVQLQQVNSPVLTPSAAVSQTAGQNVYPMTVTVNPMNAAVVWYTTDGSHPWAGNAAAIQWPLGQALNITGPCFLRARGFNAPAEYLGSKASSIFFA